jgi:MFS family permease
VKEGCKTAMSGDSVESLYTVIIKELASEDAKKRVAEKLVQITRNLPEQKILAKLGSLPWVLTRNAPEKTAIKLQDMLQSAGAVVVVHPPLPLASDPEIELTPIQPDAEAAAEPAVPRGGAQSPSPVHIHEPPFRPISPQTPPPVAPVMEQEAEPLDELPQIEPLTLGGILDKTFQICRAHFWKLLAIVGIPWAITAAIILGLALVAGVVGLTARNLGEFAPWLIIVAGVALVPSVVIVLVGLFYLSQGAMIYAVSMMYLGKKILVKEAYRFVLGRLGRYFLTSCLFVVVTVGFVLAPIVIGVILYFLSKALTSSGWWSAIFWLPLAAIPMYGITKLLLFDKVVIIEDNAYAKALSRSWHLLSGKADSPWPRGYFVRLVILLNLFLLINGAISILFRTPGAVLSVLVSEPQWLAAGINQILTSIGSLIAGVFGSVCLVVFYYDIRNRKEGFDLKMLAGLE